MTSAPPELDAARPPQAEAEDTGPLAIGAVVAERYRVVALLGMGGMGAVYRVEHVHMRKELALKVLHADAARMPEIVSRFEREAIAASSIAHPNVAAATDFGKLEDGAFFLVLELVDGRSLRDELAGGPLVPERAIRIVRAIVAAVAAAHDKGIVHRDLKPENIMLVKRDGDDDFVKVLDFGIAKVAEPDSPRVGAGAHALTRLGTIMGTPGYMSPEQALGQTVDARSDLYSLGVIFHELLVGECPFTGSAVSVLRKHLVEPPPPLPSGVTAGASDGLQAVLHRLLAKEPAARFQTATEVADALDEVMRTPAARVVVAPAAEPPRSPSSPSTPRASGRARLLLAAVVLGGATLFAALASRSETPASSGAAPIRIASRPSEPLASAIASASSLAARAAAPAPEPAPSAAPSGSASAGASRPPSRQPRKRKTGPGGIYIPPLGDLFK